MRLKRYENAVEFYNHVLPFLLAHEVEHNVLLGVLTILIKTDTYQFPPYMVCVEENGVVVAVAVRTPPHNLSLSLMESFEPLHLIADDAHQVYRDLPGVTGVRDVVKTFASIWGDVSDQTYRLNRQLCNYRLTAVSPVIGVPGEFRHADEADQAILVEWFLAFSAEVREKLSREEAVHGVDMRLTANPAIRGLRLWYDEVKPVSFAGYTGPTPNGIRIGPVYTPPEYRGRGFASALVAALSQELLDQGRTFCSLFTDLSNPTANHIYQNIGYESVCDVDEYRFEEKSERRV